MNLIALVMSGGKGTRFWPESTSAKPKQYLKLLNRDKNLLGQTLNRFDGLVSENDRYVVTVREQQTLVEQSMGQGLHDNALIFEPSGRNTGPCVLLSLAKLEALGASDDSVVAIVPADHVILNESGFRAVLKEAGELAAKKSSIVTIGIPPNFPHTGYGYIQKGEAADSGFVVEEFKEKPDRETAESYLASGKYLWNAGMFVSSIKVMKEEFASCSPEMYRYYPQLLEALKAGKTYDGIYSQIPSDSIDYAVMEKSQRVLVIPARFDWNDLGSWDALEAVTEKIDENYLVNCEGHYCDEAKGNIVYTPGKYAALVNVNDLVIVSNDKVVLVLPKKDSQKVKNIVNSLNADDSLGLT